MMFPSLHIIGWNYYNSFKIDCQDEPGRGEGREREEKGKRKGRMREEHYE
jgi:hypothetical protein